MKTLTTLLLAIVLTGCATFDRIIQLSDTVLSVPSARQELIDYLTHDELVTIADELMILDATYQPIADAIYQVSDVSIEDALKYALDSTVRKADLEKAYLEIRRVVRLHAQTHSEAIPYTLSRVSSEIEALYDEWDSIAASNQRAQAYLRVIGQIALTL